MINFRPVIDEFSLSELDMPEQFKEAVRPCVEYLLDTRASFSAAIRLAALMLESYKGDLKVTDSFADAHPENRIHIYSSPDVFLAFYFLMLAAKADNLYNAREEVKNGACTRYSVVCACDRESCSTCREKKNGFLADCTYKTVPPFHVGCRCSMIYQKD